MSDAAPAPSDLLAHAAFVRRLARSLLADAHSAEDVMQETWQRSLAHPSARPAELRAWLARVTRNLAFQRRRAEANRGARERRAARAEALPAAEASLERTETLQRVVDAVRALEEPYRATILARFYEDLPPRAIAERDGLSVETVNTRLKRALAQLRRALERERGDLTGALGLLAGESPCLPPHAGSAGGGLLLMKAKALVVVFVLAIGVVLWLPFQRPRGPVATAAPARELPASAAVEAPEEVGGVLVARAELPPTPPSERPLAGRVVDEQGAPVAGAEVLVLGHADPFAADDPHPAEIYDAFYGRRFTTDAEGRWRAVPSASGTPKVLSCSTCHTDAPAALPEPERVRVQLVEREAYVPLAPAEPRWVHTPDEHVDFVVRRRPTGIVDVRVVEGAAHTPLPSFRVRLVDRVERDAHGEVTYHGVRVKPARDGVWREELAVEDPAGRTLRVSLVEPRVAGAGADALEQEVHVLPGETAQVLFVLPERGVLRGQVVDSYGAPVAGAFVYFGAQARARGDEPFKPFRSERILDGARSGADGWFELRGEGQEVTAGHERFSSVTVDAEDASRIVLGARGLIRGRLLDAARRPVTGALVFLGNPWDGPEESASGTTDASGSFLFEGVEAGAQALWKDTGDEHGELLVCVRISAGEELELDVPLPDVRPFELVLPASALTADTLRGLLVGRERIFGLYELARGSAPDTLAIPRSVLPGRYWLATSQGLVAPLTVEPGAARVEVELGGAELRVRSKERVNLQVVPADADPFLRLVAARVYVKVVGETEGRFRLTPGRYALVGEAGVLLREVDVPAEGVTLELE